MDAPTAGTFLLLLLCMPMGAFERVGVIHGKWRKGKKWRLINNHMLSVDAMKMQQNG